MPTISITRAHSLSHKAAKDAAARVVDDLRKRFDLACEWSGDDVTFDRPGVSGRMHVGREALAIEVRLGLLLGALKSTVEREINAQLDALLAAPAKAAGRKGAKTAGPAGKSPATTKTTAAKPSADALPKRKPAARKSAAKG
jgi:putative polyhydroxyalkanoate system protein